MRRFICRIMIFCIILIPFLVAVDYAYSAMIRRSNHIFAEAWEDVVDGKIQADVIINGSSRAYVHIDPRILDSVLCVNSYNLGMDGSPINRQVQKYDMFRMRNPKPDLIVQNIDVWSLEYRIGYEQEQFYPYFWDADMRGMFFPAEPFSFAEKYIPFYRYHGVNPENFVHRRPRSLYKGYQGQEGKWDNKAYLQQASITFVVSDTTARMFDSFLSRATEEGVNVVFVYTPLYYGATLKVTNLDEMYKTYEEFAAKYDIPILDYSDMWICHDTAYFYNAMHLNKTGAEIFSDSLAHDIKRLGIL